MPPGIVLQRFARAALLLALAGSISGILPAPAAAQMEPEFFDQPYAPEQWTIGRRLDESQLRYCVDPRDPAWEVDGAIAEALARILLLEPKRAVIGSDFIVEDLTRIYEVLIKQCDVVMGFKLIPDGYPNWVVLTRPYYETNYAFVASARGMRELADLAPGRPIGATLGSSAHIRLVSYQFGIPAARRWPTFPYGTDDAALSSLLGGTVDVALVWAPSFWAKQRTDRAYADLRAIDPKPLPPTRLGVGGLLLKQNAFLRAALDTAIKALIDDGTIRSIITEYAFPAQAKS